MKKQLSLLPEALSTELASEAQELGEALVLVEGFVITPVGDPDHESSLAFAEESRALTKGQWKEYEAKRTKATGPLNQGLREVNSWFKPVLTALKAMEEAWNDKLVAARFAAQEQRRELIEETRATEEPEILRDTLVAASAAVLVPQTVSFRDHWVFEITDPDAVPREYCSPDRQKIGAVVAELKDKTVIPGVRVDNDPIVSGPSK